MSVFHKSYKKLFGLDNLFSTWDKYRRGKTNKKDIVNFELHLEDNLFGLYDNLKKLKYEHSSYEYFQVFDNKKRNIHKAETKDRIIHQIIFDHLNSIFEPEFIVDSYSSRKGKGQYKAIKTFCYFIKLAKDDQKPLFVLKCDIRRYFENIDHEILLDILKQKITCPEIFEMTGKIIKSFNCGGENKGIPLGNITSQIFANIYLDVLDKYVKNKLKCRFYVRYNDDFVIILSSKHKLEEIRSKIIHFVRTKLLLEIPLEKANIRKIDWGVDFLGFTVLPNAVLLRNKTKNKIYTNIKLENLHSYFGILNHCNSCDLKKKILAMDKLNGVW